MSLKYKTVHEKVDSNLNQYIHTYFKLIYKISSKKNKYTSRSFFSNIIIIPAMESHKMEGMMLFSLNRKIVLAVINQRHILIGKIENFITKVFKTKSKSTITFIQCDEQFYFPKLRKEISSIQSLMLGTKLMKLNLIQKTRNIIFKE